MVVMYGAITLHRDYLRSTEFIKSLGADWAFPQINASDFGLGDPDNYIYEDTLVYDYDWDNMVISYAHTTFAAIFDETYLAVFILKMEHILRNIDFAKAIVHMQSVESSQNVDLFWEKKEHRFFKEPEQLEEEYLVETDEWNFGYGRRSLAGYLEQPVNEIWHSLKDHPYPPRFSEEFSQAFLDRVSLLIKDYGTNKIPRAALDADGLLPKFELRNMMSYLVFKKLITIVEVENKFEAFQVIKPDLLKIEYLYR